MPRGLLSCLLVHLNNEGERPCFIIGGEVGAGKTRTGEQLAAALKKRDIKVGGILSPRILQDNETIGYTVYDLASGAMRPFAVIKPPGIIKIGRFFISQQGLAFSRAAIEHAAENSQVVFVDEVGRLELEGVGLASAVRTLLDSSALPVLLVRQPFISAVVRTFSIHQYISFPISEETRNEID